MSSTPDSTATKNDLESVFSIFVESAYDKYRRLFPNQPRPDYEALVRWVHDVGLTFTEFAYRIPPDKRGAALARIAHIGPVGGWRPRDGHTPDARPEVRARPDIVPGMSSTPVPALVEDDALQDLHQSAVNVWTDAETTGEWKIEVDAADLAKLTHELRIYRARAAGQPDPAMAEAEPAE